MFSLLWLVRNSSDGIIVSDDKLAGSAYSDDCVLPVMGMIDWFQSEFVVGNDTNDVDMIAVVVDPWYSATKFLISSFQFYLAFLFTNKRSLQSLRTRIDIPDFNKSSEPSGTVLSLNF